MNYRRVGKSGLQISELSFGSWVTFGGQLSQKEARELMACAYDNGVNFFDNAEVYAGGHAETMMGKAFKKLGWSRLSYVVSTKFFWGIEDHLVNSKNTLNRKYLAQAIEGSLKRLDLDYVDIAYCHRHDPNTPMEEIVLAMHDMVQKGQTLYWGTSEWPQEALMEAYRLCDLHHLHKPIVEQPQYSLIHRNNVEKNLKSVIKKHGIGLTTWSPLASGILTGKYLEKIPKGSRGEKDSLSFLKEEIESEARKRQIEAYVELCKAHDLSPASAAIAWCLRNQDVSSVILGATSEKQLLENLKALETVEKITPEFKEKAEGIFS